MRGLMTRTDDTPSYDDLAAGSTIHVVSPLSGAILILPRPDCDTLVAHLYEQPDRNYAILPRVGPKGGYASAEVMRLN